MQSPVTVLVTVFVSVLTGQDEQSNSGVGLTGASQLLIKIIIKILNAIKIKLNFFIMTPPN